MITVVQNNQKYEVRFTYNTDILSMIKSTPTRMWHPEGKYWDFDLKFLGFFTNQVKNSKYANQLIVQSQESIDQNDSIDFTPDIPDVDISEINYRVADGLQPLQHQLDSMKFFLDRKRRGLRSGFILADQMGCGKTCQVMNMALYNKQYEQAKHCLIICCVNSAKYNWVDDIKKHTNGEYKPYILGSRLRRDGSVNLVGGGQEKLEDLLSMRMYGGKGEPLPYFLVVNIEAFRTKSKTNRRAFPFTELVIKRINEGQISMIALDEVHKNASMKSAQGKQLLKLKLSVNRQIEWIPMTGTPIVNKPTDVFLPLRLVDGHYSASYYKWCENFCMYGGYGDHEIIGYKNIPELKEMLQPNMLRRLKEQVLDLPEKIYMTEYVENTDYQEKLYKKVLTEILSEKASIAQSMNPLVRLLKLRQVNGAPELVDENLTIDKTYITKNAKIAKIIELVDDIIANNEKVIIFSNWVETLRTLFKVIGPKYDNKICVYTGTMDQESREKNKRVFMNNPDYHILLGTIGALGTSHTLTVARNVIFEDTPWNTADFEQAVDRVHRPGQHQTVHIYKIITKDTVDERVNTLMEEKGRTSEFIVDNKLDFKANPKLLDYLLYQT